MKTFVSKYYPGIFLFFCFVIIGLFNYKDYGASWDEGAQIQIGRKNYDYVLKGDTSFFSFKDRDYGPGFELPLTGIENVLHLTAPRDIFLTRHLVNHLFFVLSLLFAYILFYRLFNNTFIACIGFLLLAMHPRIYAHSFFNTKDIPFLSMTVIALCITEIAFHKDKTKWYLLLGCVCGYLASLRIIGILLALFICLFFLLDIIFAQNNKTTRKNVLKHAVTFVVIFIASFYLFFPFLWTDPINHIITCYKNSIHFRWPGSVLLQGRNISVNTLPKRYIPLWFSITTPMLWVIAGIAGYLLLLVKFIKTPLRYLMNTPYRNFILYAGFFLAPMGAVIILHSVVYDDWRHLYFIYAAFVPIVLFVMNELLKTRVGYIIQIACVLQLSWVGVFMLRYYPFGQVYFNEFVSHRNEYLRKNYELDYWGCAYKQALTYIIDNDKSGVIKVAGNEAIIKYNIAILPEGMRKRIEYDGKDAAYFITNFRWHPDDYDEYGHVFHEIRVLNSTINRVYKIR